MPGDAKMADDGDFAGRLMLALLAAALTGGFSSALAFTFGCADRTFFILLSLGLSAGTIANLIRI